jgi:hypothetical protein
MHSAKYGNIRVLFCLANSTNGVRHPQNLPYLVFPILQKQIEHDKIRKNMPFVQ